MSTPTEHQKHVTQGVGQSMKHNAGIEPAFDAINISTVPVLSSGINNGNFTQPSEAPQVQVHISEAGGASSRHHLSQDAEHTSNGPPAPPTVVSQQQQSSSSASSSSGSYAQSSHLTNPASNGTSPHTTPSPAIKNASLAAPGAVAYSQLLGQAGVPALHALDGRISPRPISRNQTRTPQYHGKLYNPDNHGRAPGDTRMQLFVGNLPFRVRWQDLKDLFRKCGSVLRSDVALTLDNRSKGFGTVLYANEEDALNAIQTFNGYTWQSRVLDVRVDQQDPTGSISLANAAAQQAQHHAYQTHQQAMQNMANMVGVAQNAAAAAMFQQGYPMFGTQGPASSPWMAAAMANNFRSGTNFLPPPHGQSPIPAPAGLPPFGMPGRAPSPYKAVQLGDDLAHLSLRRNSASTEGSSRPSIPQSGSSSSLGPPRGRGDSLPMGHTPTGGPSSRPGTSPASPVTAGERLAKAGSPSPTSGYGDHRESVSPTSARRPPPGNLGPMPPSIFAGMPQNAHLPHPPAAAAAAVAAGYSIDKEVPGTSRQTTSPYDAAAKELASGSDSRRNSGSFHDQSLHPGQQSRQQQVSHLGSERSASPMAGVEGSNLQAAVPFPGGLANFYQQQQLQHQRGPMHPPSNMFGSGRNSPSPALADRQLFVGNIPFNCQWQDLKDLFRAAGQIQRADVSLGPDGRSRGFGRVVFATPEDAVNAMQMFNGYEFQGRPLKVHFDKFAPGGSPFSHLPPMNMQTFDNAQNPIYNGVHQSQFIQPSNNQNMNQPYQNNARTDGNGQPSFNQQQGGQNWLPAGAAPSLPFDDNASVPGTPIHEMSLAQMAAFPSPGFSSPMQHQQAPGQPADMRRRGFNADGVPVAPIGSGAPHGQQEHRGHMQQNHPMPLSPLTIPPMSMAMPSPGPGGLFSPPLPGMGPLMTPSMPGFSFHPFPQTPPLLPQFLSPGLGPFSPPLMTPGTFFAYNGPSSLRNSAPGDNDSTPLQSPHMSYPYSQQDNYFPPLLDQPSLPDQPQGNGEAIVKEASSLEPTSSVLPDSTALQEEKERIFPSSDIQGNTTPTLAVPASGEPTAATEDGTAVDGSPDTTAPSGRRASFKDSKSNSMLDVPPSSNNRGGSLDIPRPNLHLGDITSGASDGSALDDNDDGTPPANGSPAEAASATSPATTAQSKKSAWNLSWLKKQ